MCECGCTGNDKQYSMPGPNGSIYVVILHGGCLSCDSPAGIAIEYVEPSDGLFEEYRSGDYIDGPMPFEQWPDCKGAAIVVGYRKHEFVAAVQSHLIGVSSDDMGIGGAIDELGAEVIAEEMYEDARFCPQLVPPAKPQSPREAT